MEKESARRRRRRQPKSKITAPSLGEKIDEVIQIMQSHFSENEMRKRIVPLLLNEEPIEDEDVRKQLFSGAAIEEEEEEEETEEEEKEQGDENQEEEPEVDPKMLARRRKIIDEILSTEKTYHGNLDVVNRVFIQPLKNPAYGLKKQELDALFANWESLAIVNGVLLNDLNERMERFDEMNTKIGGVFLRSLPFLKLYTFYCQNYSYALNMLTILLKKNSKFRVFTEQAITKPECNGLNLDSFLIMPVQRIPRYNLLLQDLLKHTPAHHSDYRNIDWSLDDMKEMAIIVNESMRAADETKKLLEIQSTIADCDNLFEPGRKLIRQGELTAALDPAMKKNEDKKLIVFLFSDCIVTTRRVGKLVGKEKSRLKHFVMLAGASADMVPKAVGLNMFEIQTEEGRSLVFVAENAIDRKEWLDDVQKAIEAQKEE